MLNILANERWVQSGVTIAGGNGKGADTNQLNRPYGFCIDEDQTVAIADCDSHRIVQWKKGEANGQIVAGGNRAGNRLDQLHCPTDVLIDKETDSFIICDRENRRVARWLRKTDTTEGEILLDDIDCYGLAKDDQRYLYVADYKKHEVRRYRAGDKNGTLVAGGHGRGAGLHQLNMPRYLFVDRQQTVYVSESDTHRVMKWKQGAKAGIVVAGGQGEGNALTQLASPRGIFVDALSTLYVADSKNDRVVRWSQRAHQGTVIVGGNGRGTGQNQFNWLMGLSFDRHGNLYVVDHNNHRVQQFSLE
ncbi:unnamed protein product [Rotaria socialis]|uniref:NHL repeat-containing protein n=1 Tax=Rotaria socialis TaxID=392032 RepID=A0A821HVB9_9BILA|nr:unnamed protein product [Rotaria socialis]CAF3346420.1 unnamed protein product [Rotaria socialis]CAF3386557.1 unnamed protein product [Rotaria socialis]CAF3499806.1 unnamed protein product [Rotaria socialis]CAF3697606.1 unnamed protein product [Rotaria socialis]